ncbi:tRNA lysidine(34) synthetase TilS [Dongia sp.]|uniref:tRNA lysidine(34) synthetase TilS n=1 Tax=Dongia sp. TaxID=1977262 RepID=UPI0035B46EDB
MGPFEHAPQIAVAVSGGADSLALMHLLKNWVAGHGGRLTALTVDHGLRPESAAEAAQVSAWAAAAGIDHRILRWTGDKPTGGLQAAARAARYDLMTDWCRAAQVHHLLIAHQFDDQRETIAMRRARNPDSDLGLAGMSAITVRNGIRLLRPLLNVPGADLRAYLREHSLAWIEDPSNQSTRFERIRWRQGLEGPLPDRADIARWGRQRQALEAETGDHLLRAVEIHPAGHVLIDLDAWGEGPEPVRHLALTRLIGMIGGGDHPPAKAALARIEAGLRDGAPVASLGGTLIGRWRGRGLVCREAGCVRHVLVGSGLWDGRFEVSNKEEKGGEKVSILGDSGIAEIGLSGYSRTLGKDIPPIARPALPAIRDATGRLIYVPYLGFDPYGRGESVQIRFLPRNSATSSGFTVAHGWPHTI